jgi:hypothetical protein
MELFLIVAFWPQKNQVLFIFSPIYFLNYSVWHLNMNRLSAVKSMQIQPKLYDIFHPNIYHKSELNGLLPILTSELNNAARGKWRCLYNTDWARLLLPSTGAQISPCIKLEHTRLVFHADSTLDAVVALHMWLGVRAV